MNGDRQWYLKKEIPLGTIVTLGIQTLALIAGGSWFLSNITSEIKEVKGDVYEINEWIDERPRDLPKNMPRRITIVENNQEHLTRAINKLEIAVNRLNEKLEGLR